MIAGLQPAGMQGPYLPRSEWKRARGNHERDINDLVNRAGVPKSRPRTHRNQAEQQESKRSAAPHPPTPLNHHQPSHLSPWKNCVPGNQSQSAKKVGDHWDRILHIQSKRIVEPHNGRQQAEHRNKLGPTQDRMRLPFAGGSDVRLVHQLPRRNRQLGYIRFSLSD